jgi:hypothetical protein
LKCLQAVKYFGPAKPLSVPVDRQHGRGLLLKNDDAAEVSGIGEMEQRVSSSRAAPRRLLRVGAPLG